MNCWVFTRFGASCRDLRAFHIARWAVFTAAWEKNTLAFLFYLISKNETSLQPVKHFYIGCSPEFLWVESAARLKCFTHWPLLRMALRSVTQFRCSFGPSSAPVASSPVYFQTIDPLPRIAICCCCRGRYYWTRLLTGLRARIPSDPTTLLYRSSRQLLTAVLGMLAMFWRPLAE